MSSSVCVPEFCVFTVSENVLKFCQIKSVDVKEINLVSTIQKPNLIVSLHIFTLSINSLANFCISFFSFFDRNVFIFRIIFSPILNLLQLLFARCTLTSLSTQNVNYNKVQIKTIKYM